MQYIWNNKWYLAQDHVCWSTVHHYDNEQNLSHKMGFEYEKATSHLQLLLWIMQYLT